MNIYIENKKFYNHIVYSFETLFRCIQINDLCFCDFEESSLEKTQIYYGKNKPKKFKGIYIKEGDLFSDIYLSDDSIPKLPLMRYNSIPILYGVEDGIEPTIISSKDTEEIQFDIIQGVFFLVTGYEEILAIDKPVHDIHSRYHNEKRLLYREKYLYRPLVNEYAYLLKNCMERMGYDFSGIEHVAYAHISHDVDNPYSEVSKFRKKINKKLHRRNAINIDKGFQTIIDIEKEYHICSSWYFMTGYNNAGYDFKYSLKDRNIEELISILREKGDEIGWHYSYNAAFDSIQARQEYVKFFNDTGEKPEIGRSHYLRYEIPKSWNWYSRLGMKYDATLGSAQHEGFIYGICTPFQLFDAIEGKNLGVWEIPLIVMDGTICSEQYRGLSQYEVMEVIENLVDVVKEYDGVFSILWHNSSLKNKKWKKWEQTYIQIMKLLGENMNCLTGEEIIKRISK